MTIPRSIIALCAIPFLAANDSRGAELDFVRVSVDGTHFVAGESAERFVVWGVNYDHDHEGRLIEDYWHDDWDTVVEDFREMRALGANVVRVHLQLGRFMKSAEQPRERELDRLAKLVTLAEETGLYLDLTGLGCYHAKDVPKWYDALAEADRWDVQARFWRAVAKVGRESPAIFCYDLMNEPILPGWKVETEWVTGNLGGKSFVQRIALDLGNRDRMEVAKAWVAKLTTAIREIDERHLITVGVIPWVFAFGGGTPLFHSKEVGEPLDFVAVHFYPEKGEVAKALEALEAYDVGKPIVVEETFPLKCSVDELDAFVRGGRDTVDGWIGFYWGRTAEEYDRDDGIQAALMKAWLAYFRKGVPAGD